MLVGCCECVRVDIVCVHELVLWWGRNCFGVVEGGVVMGVCRLKGGGSMGEVGAKWKEGEMCFQIYG